MLLDSGTASSRGSRELLIRAHKALPGQPALPPASGSQSAAAPGAAASLTAGTVVVCSGGSAAPGTRLRPFAVPRPLSVLETPHHASFLSIEAFAFDGQPMVLQKWGNPGPLHRSTRGDLGTPSAVPRQHATCLLGWAASQRKMGMLRLRSWHDLTQVCRGACSRGGLQDSLWAV